MRDRTHGFRGGGTPFLRLAGCVLAGLLPGLLLACDPVSDAEEDAIVAWLGCDECTEGERAFVVDSIGPRAVPFLRDALLGLPQEYRDNMERSFGARWSRIESPAVDSATYVSRFVSNFDAVVQRRAARALGDLGQVQILQGALNQRGALGYRDDVVQVLEESLSAALVVTGRSVPSSGPVDSVEVWPQSMTLEVGETALVEAVVTDTDGNVVSAPVAWSSLDPSVATVTPRPNRPSAQVEAVATGHVEVRAVAGGERADASVTVVPVPPPGLVLFVEAGDPQPGSPGTVLPQPLVVRVEDQGGVTRSGVQVTWRVVFGSATFTLSGTGSATTSTGPQGRSSVLVRLGPDLGLVSVKASLSGGSSKNFRLRVVP